MNVLLFQVMRLIQNKLSTPTSSMEHLNQYNKYVKPEPKSHAISNKQHLETQSTSSASKTVQEETISTQEIVASMNISTDKTVPEVVAPKLNGSTTPTFAESLPPKIEQKEEQPPPPKPAERVYKYRGPPTISMSTWSERPKVPVNIKEDADYKLSNHNVNSKLIVSTTNNDVTSNNTVEIRNNYNNHNQISDTKGVSIKVNGTEPGTTNGKQYHQSGSTGNVVIKIGSMNGDNRPKTIDNQRFISHTTAVGYRKPFSTLSNNNDNQITQRPHSIAFDSEFDISRVPVVRSFELKKPYKDFGNTSVTQIYHQESNGTGKVESNPEPISRFASIQNRYKEPEETSELAKRFATLNNRSSYSNTISPETREPKPVFRVTSFKPVGSAPVVRGFKPSVEVSNNRKTWNGTNAYNTLPAKPKEVDSSRINTHVPYSQSQLRRAESNKTVVNQNSHPPPTVGMNNFNSLPSVQKQPEIKAPPPPMMPKHPAVVRRPPVEPVVDQRDQLLSAIRNFGGKKGLKAVKV